MSDKYRQALWFVALYLTGVGALLVLATMLKSAVALL